MAIAAFQSSSHGQVVINAPPTVVGDGFQLNAGQTLNVGVAGVVGHNLRANDGSVVNISGGSIGLRLFANSGSAVNISGGNVGSIDGALVGSFTAFSNSTVNISGGTVGDEFEARRGSKIEISGGTVGRQFEAALGSDVELIGNDFRLNGVEYVGDLVTLTRHAIREFVFTGTLSDGTPIVFSALPDQQFYDVLHNVMLTRVGLPTPNLAPIAVDSLTTAVPRGLRTGQSLTVLPGGLVRGDVAVNGSSIVNISGGKIAGVFWITENSVVNLSGGTFGNGFQAHSGSQANLFGRQFFLDDTPLSALRVGEAYTIVNRNATLSGRLADGNHQIVLDKARDRQQVGAMANISQSVLTVQV